MQYRAQLALLVEQPPSGPNWLHELKLDGYRIGILIEGGHVRLMSRRGTEWTAEFPEVVSAARRLRMKNAIIDGEVVMLTERGTSSFEALQNRRSSGATLAYFAFDLLAHESTDVWRLPLIERKDRLRKLVDGRDRVIRYTQHFEDEGADVLRQACALGAEGIVSKRRDAPYRPGARHPDWQKSKCSKRQEFIVGGFTDPSGSRVGVGSILVGFRAGNALRFAGKVGTGRGWGAEFGRELRRKLEAIETPSSPFTPPPPGWLGRNAHWVKPVHVVEVDFTEWTSGGHIRHPSLLGFRRDKAAAEVVREKPMAASPLVFARLKIRRSDLAALYEDIARWALPHVAGRPLTVVCCKGPITRADALRSQCVFVRHTARDNAWAPKEVPRVRIQEQRKAGEYLHVETIEHLTALIERGVVEWHVWNARVDDVERPDRIVLDLDPGDGVPWHTVISAARHVRDALAAVRLKSWVKTTGGRGLHVVVPFRPDQRWDDVFAFSRAFAETLERGSREKYTTSFAKTSRAGKVLIDYKRNHRTSIAVAAFSSRALPTAPISMPVRWSELTRRLAPDRFTVENIRARVARRADPWKDYWSCDQRLPRTR